jgi:thiol-disulfide isomerase/thioredoxin
VKRLLAGAAVVLLLVVVTLVSRNPEARDVLPPDVDVDTAELREVKQRIGMADCEPGPGDEPVADGLPELELPCLGGGSDVDLSTLRGPLVLNVWAHWCPPCGEEMPVLEAFHQRYGDRVQVVGMNVNDLNPGKALALAESTGATYPSLADPGGEVFSSKAFAVAQRGFPAFVFVAEDGTVAGVAAGGVDSLEQIEDLVREHLGVRL